METTIRSVESQSGSTTRRSLLLAYGIASYFIGVSGLASFILVLAQLVPFGFFGLTIQSSPLLFNLGLVVIWGTIHSGMARSGFKQFITKIIPVPAERATYVLIAGLTSIALTGLWQPLTGVLWWFEAAPVKVFLWALFASGWLYLLAATFAINHFDLFGLRQVYLNFRNQPCKPVPFVKRAMYSFSRHPIQTGVLVGLWVTPLMTVTQLVLSIAMTSYIFAGLWLEERDLIKDIGERYVAYRKETGMFLPKFGRSVDR